MLPGRHGSQPALPPCRPEACKSFLKDLLDNKLRYGPLLGYSFVQGCKFVVHPELNYVEPQIYNYDEIGTAGNAVIELWAGKFGVRIPKPLP
jgi:hypothetical protein